MNPEPTIYLVDDDLQVLKSLNWMIGSVYHTIESYSSGTEFLAHYDGISHGCVILDMRMQDMTGLEVQTRLAERGADLPVIVMTGHADIPICTKCFRAGAFDFIVKPAAVEDLLDRISQALEIDLEKYQARLQRATQEARMAKLTPREKEVVLSVLEGKTLKQIANEFNISIQTASKHRASALRKLEVENDVELTRILLNYSPG